MVRATNEILIDIENGKKIANLFGSSKDEKPTTAYCNGAIFMEVDTGKIFLFDESNSTWTQLG